MMHKNRIHTVAKAESAEDLAHKLTEHTWCGCNGWELDGYYFLNDSTSPDGAGEWAVIKISTGIQVESITFSWCTYDMALQYIKQAIAGEFDSQALDTHYKIDNSETHRCHLCA